MNGRDLRNKYGDKSDGDCDSDVEHLQECRLQLDVLSGLNMLTGDNPCERPVRSTTRSASIMPNPDKVYVNRTSISRFSPMASIFCFIFRTSVQPIVLPSCTCSILRKLVY